MEKKSSKKILILVGNPVASSFSRACAEVYERTAKKMGSQIKRFNIEEMDFDPTLHEGYEVIQELEPDLVAFQKAVKWADHLVFIYPNWWSTMPAKMKGIFDRCFLPGHAFKMVDGKFTPLLKGRSARVINIVGTTHPFTARMLYGDYTNELRRGILNACGVSPVRIICFGPTSNSPEEKRTQWLQQVERIAKRESV